MSEENQGNIKVISSGNVLVRIGLVAGIIFAIIFAWLTVSWQLGNMLAELTLPTEANAKDIAQLAVGFSPNDPLANWLKTSTGNDVFSPENALVSVAEHEQIVRLSPYNFSWWVELGRANEQADKMENAEKAFQHAVELAPEYTFPHWQLGNYYLRQGNDQKAFAELQKAAENNAVYREQVFSIAWDYYDKDTKRLEEIAGNEAETRAGLAKFYAAKEQAVESLRMWNTLSPEEKKGNTDVAKIITQAFYEKKFYRQALEFVRDLGMESDAQQETVNNGSFEGQIIKADESYFGWKDLRLEKMEVKLDPSQNHEGKRSLRVLFERYDKPELYNIYQIVTVEPSAQYNLSFWIRASELKSAGMPVLEVIRADDNKIIATSDSFAVGTYEWKQINIKFTASENSEAVIIRTSRAYCGNACPIIGTLWYDDFKLEKLSGQKKTEK